MSGEPRTVVVWPKAIDNSQVVREVDPRSSRELLLLLALVALLCVALGLYAWPHLKVREAGLARQQLEREREALLEENRKLRLEKASLENLRRIEAIAARELDLVRPAATDVVVVERPEQAARDRVALDGREAVRNP